MARDGKILLLKLSVTEDDLTAETGLTIKILLLNWHIINPAFYHDELPLYRWKENSYSDTIKNHKIKNIALSYTGGKACLCKTLLQSRVSLGGFTKLIITGS